MWKKMDSLESNKTYIPHLIIAMSVLVYTVYCYVIMGKFEIVNFLFMAWVFAEILLVVIGVIFHRKPMKHFKNLIKVLQISEIAAYIILIVGMVIYLQIYCSIRKEGEAFIQNARSDEYQCVLVLGAQPIRGEMDEKLIDRLDYLIALRGAFDESKTEYIVSGGTGRTEHSDVTEAELMQEYLLRQGFPAEKLSMESSAISTYENLIFTRNKWQDSELIVISSDYHLPRVKVLLEDLGCERYRLLGAPTDKDIKPCMMLQEMLGIVAWKLGFY